MTKGATWLKPVDTLSDTLPGNPKEGDRVLMSKGKYINNILEWIGGEWVQQEYPENAAVFIQDQKHGYNFSKRTDSTFKWYKSATAEDIAAGAARPRELQDLKNIIDSSAGLTIHGNDLCIDIDSSLGFFGENKKLGVVVAQQSPLLSTADGLMFVYNTDNLTLKQDEETGISYLDVAKDFVESERVQALFVQTIENFQEVGKTFERLEAENSKQNKILIEAINSNNKVIQEQQQYIQTIGKVLDQIIQGQNWTIVETDITDCDIDELQLDQPIIPVTSTVVVDSVLMEIGSKGNGDYWFLEPNIIKFNYYLDPGSHVMIKGMIPVKLTE